MRKKPLVCLRSLALIICCLASVLAGCQPQAIVSPPVQPTESYQVIVFGGEPEGVAAAVAAARNGCRTLLLVPETELGGLFTQSKLNTLDLNYAPDGSLANTGIFGEFFRAIGQHDAFDVDQAVAALSRLAQQEDNLTVLYNRTLTSLEQTSTHLGGVTVMSLSGPEHYLGGIFIDASADAELAARCGVPFTLLREDIGEPGIGMGSTLMLHLRGVDWPALRAEAASGRLGYASSSTTAVWGLPEIARLYQPSRPEVFLRGLNVGRQQDGSVLINAMVIFGVDPLNPESYQQGVARGQAEAPLVLEWLRDHVGGFAQAELVELPKLLYVRESRHLQGLYRLTASDVLDNCMFPDAIAFGSYPIDIQAATPADRGFVVGTPQLYSVPLRSLIPPDLDNLLVTGRSASYDSLAAGSARVVPVGMSTAQAAGVAAAVALSAQVPVQTLAQPEYYQSVQQRLQQQGVRWLVRDYHSVFPDHPATPALKQLVNLGLVIGNYDNQWGLQQVADERLAARLLAVGLQRVRDDAESTAHIVYAAGRPGVPLTAERLRELTELAVQRLTVRQQADWLNQLLGQYAANGYDRGLLYQFIAEFLQQMRQ